MYNQIEPFCRRDPELVEGGGAGRRNPDPELAEGEGFLEVCVIRENVNSRGPFFRLVFVCLPKAKEYESTVGPYVVAPAWPGAPSLRVFCEGWETTVLPSQQKCGLSQGFSSKRVMNQLNWLSAEG